MSARVKYRGPCPRCRKDGRDRHGDNLVHYDDGHSFCFSCRYQEGLKSPEIALNRRLSDFNQLDVPKEYPMLPDDAGPYLPAVALEWLKKYYITSEDISRSRLMWSDSREYLIFPFFGETRDELVAWQGRYFGERTTHPKWFSKGDLQDVVSLHDVLGRKGECLVLVEDIISAIRVGNSAASVCIFGSYVDSARLLHLRIFTSGSIVLWLDPDKRKESIKFAKLAHSLGFESRIVLTDRDPKEYTDEEIQEILK